MERSQVFDVDEALARLDGDRELFADLAALFLEESPKELAGIRAALSGQDAPALAAAAHKLKGSVMQFCAPRLFENVKQLETFGRAANLDEAHPLYAVVERQLAELQEALRLSI